MATPFRNTPAQRRLLDAIAAGESAYGSGAGYDVMYGGGRFGSFGDHPRQYIPIQSGPNKGKTSSAAGRYQFLARTWDETAKELGLPDFSPESQDQAAWHLAAKTYAAKTGRDLTADLEAGRTQDIAPALAGVWTSIPGGIEPNKATAGFTGRLGSDAPTATASAAPTGNDAPAATPGQPMGLLPSLAEGKGDPVQGLLAGLLGQQSQAPAGLLGGMPQQQQQAPEPAPSPPLVGPEQMMQRRRPLDLAGLQAVLQRPRLGAGWRV